MPFMVSIQVKKKGSMDYEHFCGGSIIHKNFVLTAAHCFHEFNNPSTLFVVGGNNELNIGKSDQRRKVRRLQLHESFIPLYGFDIALVEVYPEFDFSDDNFAKIDYLVKTEETVGNGTEAWLLGWAHSYQHLEQVKFEIISRDLCRQKGFKYVTMTEICAVSFKGRGACDGDSGGPLISLDYKYILGLLSFGKSFCQIRRIYAFTWLKPLIPWINQKINANKS